VQRRSQVRDTARIPPLMRLPPGLESLIVSLLSFKFFAALWVPAIRRHPGLLLDQVEESTLNLSYRKRAGKDDSAGPVALEKRLVRGPLPAPTHPPRP
jgi:hypothetical protein